MKRQDATTNASCHSTVLTRASLLSKGPPPRADRVADATAWITVDSSLPVTCSISAERPCCQTPIRSGHTLRIQLYSVERPNLPWTGFRRAAEGCPLAATTAGMAPRIDLASIPAQADARPTLIPPDDPHPHAVVITIPQSSPAAASAAWRGLRFQDYVQPALRVRHSNRNDSRARDGLEPR